MRSLLRIMRSNERRYFFAFISLSNKYMTTGEKKALEIPVVLKFINLLILGPVKL